MADLLAELKERAQQVKEYILNSRFQRHLKPDYIKKGALLYTSQGGKMLRPTILLLACEAVGGDPQVALPAAAAIEMSHTWTLVHDDVIDNDSLRRGGPSVHAYYQEHFRSLLASDLQHKELSRNLAILVGDLQQAWAVNLMNELDKAIDAKLLHFLIKDLTLWVSQVLEGETLDIEYSKCVLGEIDETAVLDMLSKKTASTFGLAGRMGALIGLNKLEPENELVKTLESICVNAGMAFQLKDDILGLVGNEKQLGKPVGSDIQEGKQTIIIIHAYQQADNSQKDFIKRILGQDNISQAEIDQLRQLVIKLGSIDYTEKLARDYTNRAMISLKMLPESRAKVLLGEWITFIVERVF